MEKIESLNKLLDSAINLVDETLEDEDTTKADFEETLRIMGKTLNKIKEMLGDD